MDLNTQVKSNKVSYENMLHEISINHVRRSLTSQNKKKFSVCCTPIGWLCRKMKDNSLEQDIAGEVGVAIILYFKQLKCLMILLLILSVLSLPQLILISMQVTTDNFNPYMLNIGLFGQSTVQCG